MFISNVCGFICVSVTNRVQGITLEYPTHHTLLGLGLGLGLGLRLGLGLGIRVRG